MSDSERILKLEEHIARLEALITKKDENVKGAKLVIDITPDMILSPKAEAAGEVQVPCWKWSSVLGIPKKTSSQAGFILGSREKAFLVALYAGLQHAGLYTEAREALELYIPSSPLNYYLISKISLSTTFDEDIIDRYNRVVQLIEAFPKITIIVK